MNQMSLVFATACSAINNTMLAAATEVMPLSQHNTSNTYAIRTEYISVYYAVYTPASLELIYINLCLRLNRSLWAMLQTAIPLQGIIITHQSHSY